jgi:hypothetical protein
MTDEFIPATDLPDRIDDDDRPVVSSARMRDEAIQARRKKYLLVFLAGLTALLLITGFPPLQTLIGVAIMYVLLKTGFAIVGSFARPIPTPPPPGELRKVRLQYRCAECGTELRITLANDEVPEPPRHCTEPMELTATWDDAL